MIEEYKPIPNLEGYFASNLGNIKSSKRKEKKVLSKMDSNKGYQVVVIYQNKKFKMEYVARLVLAAFVGFPTDEWLCVANYKDGNKKNCSLENLYWEICKTTSDYNPALSHRRGVLKPDSTKSRMHNSKLNQNEETLRKGAISRNATCSQRPNYKGTPYTKYVDND